ncbi:Nucleoporin NIC96 [Candida viswanathii]|uniref:Nuclear pore protein n=1 Tax=Candida viswanathii TaxID=5486 RepID=A0A367XP33_9ASCO|nr:Nucleoporin NIC96 [Candida viswanathii]
MFGNKMPLTGTGTGFSFGGQSTTNTNTGQTQNQFQQQPQQPQQAPPVTIGANVQSTINPPAGPISGTATNLSLPVSVNTTKGPKLLKELLESANNLPKSNDHVQLGSIHLTLNELERKTQQLRRQADDSASFTKAHYLLAGSGISADDIEGELNAIQIPKTSERGAPLQHTFGGSENIENYLSAKKDENILNTIEQSLSLASKDFDNYINANISIDWKVRRDELRKAVGLKTNVKVEEETIKNSIIWKSNSTAANILTPLGDSSVRQLTRAKFENYARVVDSLNGARLQDRHFPLCLNFNEVNKLQNDVKGKQVAEIWKILVMLTGEKYAKTSQEQKFFNTPKNELNGTIVDNSIAYLQQEFYNYVDELYLKDANKPQKYSPATNINKISYFVNQVVLKDDPELINKTQLVNGTPIWALIFYLLRAGLYPEAVDLVFRNRELFSKFDKNFPIYIKSYADSSKHVLSSELNERLHKEFNQQFQFIINDVDTSINYDPYKYSVYKIIGKCDLSNKSLPPSINLSIEEWVWFHLSIINENQPGSESNLVFENYSLLDFQNKIIQLGPKNFLASPNNPLYLKTLVLAGLYEMAVQYAYEFVNEADSVHLAIGLAYYGLLKCSPFNKDNLLTVNNNEYEINYSRLVGSYTTTFKISDPKVACEYLILIALSNGGDSKSALLVCHEALRELILVSREFGILLGQLNQVNGTKLPGILETQRKLIRLENIDQFYQQIVEVAASKCEEEGRIFDALLLYQLCCDYNTVVSLINKLLAEILATTDLNQPTIKFGNYEVLSTGYATKDVGDTIDNNIILLAQHIMKVFSNNSHILSKLSPKIKSTCDLLLPIINIRELFLKKDWSAVVNEINKLDLVPADANADIIKIRNMSELVQTNDLDDNLVKVIPSLLILVITSISHLNYEILTRRYQSYGNEKDALSHWKKIAKNCMIYAGMVQYKMPRETYSLLINLESLL